MTSTYWFRHPTSQREPSGPFTRDDLRKALVAGTLPTGGFLARADGPTPPHAASDNWSAADALLTAKPTAPAGVAKATAASRRADVVANTCYPGVRIFLSIADIVAFIATAVNGFFTMTSRTSDLEDKVVAMFFHAACLTSWLLFSCLATAFLDMVDKILQQPED